MEKKEIAKGLVKNISCKNFRVLVSSLEDGNKGLYIILKVISELEGEVIASDIAEILGVSIVRVTVAVKALEAKGFVKRVRSLIDKRKTIITLTEEGKKIVKEKEENLLSIIELLLDKLTEEESEQLLNISRKINSFK